MKKVLWILGWFGLVSIILGPLAFSNPDHEWEDQDEEFAYSGASAMNNPLYKQECGSCHFAYPPSFLPARSWEKIMKNLSDHFGENAEFLPET